MEIKTQPSANVTSGQHESVWLSTADSLVYDTISADLKTHVVIVGAGISGLTTAYCLAKAGKQVVVLEDGNIASGESGRTTAHIANALDDQYGAIEKTFGEEYARLAAESHTAAIDFIESTIVQENLQCDFLRLNGYLFLHASDKIKTLEDELDASRRAGLFTELLPAVPQLPSHEGPCLMFPGQAQFHPLKYLNALSKAIINLGGRIFTRSHVTDVHKTHVKVNGFTVHADHIVVATNSPVNDIVTMHTKQHPYRTYVVAAEIPKGSLEAALWWDTGDKNSTWVTEPYHYVRTQPYNHEFDLLICGGEDHKTGQAEKENIAEEDRYQVLEQWAREKFPMMQRIVYRWSGQVLEPVDMLAFIGRNPGDENIYIATGDSGNGITHGTIAGMLISDLIQGKENEWEKLYDPSRITFSKTGDFIREGSNMAAQYLDYFTPGDFSSVGEIQPGAGAIIRAGIKKIAVYRDETAQLHAFSAVCPHLGCVVRWNSDEKSFDCPCHGSRFTCEGKVVNGPSTSDLAKMEIREDVVKH